MRKSIKNLLKWDAKTYVADNAILELETPIPEWSDFIMPACIHIKDKGWFSNRRSLIGWSLRLNLIGRDSILKTHLSFCPGSKSQIRRVIF